MSNLRNELEATNYHQLKDKYQELGISDAFVNGSKKVDLINTAIEVLSKIKESEVNPIEAVDILQQEKIEDEVMVKSSFDKEVEEVVSKEELWTLQSIEKRIRVLGNIFLQHRGNPKGNHSLHKQLVLIAAKEIMYK
tara:strand:- start:184 stop:594 length:411 start_codon:yes stop_codon:yes gene_type:complete